MVLIGTKNDLQASWVKRTGSPVSETRHRIRVLSEAGILPVRSHVMSWCEFAYGLIGFAVGGQHINAVERVRRFGESHCNTVAGHDVAKPALSKYSLVDALAAALQPPFKVFELEVSTTNNFAVLKVEKQGRLPGPITEYHFGFPTLGLETDVDPIVSVNRLGGKLIGFLLNDLTQTDVKARNAAPGRAASQADQSNKPRTRSGSANSDPNGPGASVSTRKTASEMEFCNECASA